jgi:hypothetical protein
MCLLGLRLAPEVEVNLRAGLGPETARSARTSPVPAYLREKPRLVSRSSRRISRRESHFSQRKGKPSPSTLPPPVRPPHPHPRLALFLYGACDDSRLRVTGEPSRWRWWWWWRRRRRWQRRLERSLRKEGERRAGEEGRRKNVGGRGPGWTPLGGGSGGSSLSD